MEYMGDKEPTELRERIYLVTGVVVIAFIAITSRLWYLQVMEGEVFKELSLNNRIRIIRTDAPRGLILDRSGIRLAENRPGFDLLIVPEDVTDWARTKRIITVLAEIDMETIDDKLKKAKGRAPFKPIKLKEDITWKEMSRIESFKFELPGISLQAGPKRVYPFKEITAHIIGYLGEINQRELKRLNNPTEKAAYRIGDRVGKSGLEVLNEGDLKGTDGGRQVEVDAHGRILKVIKSVPPDPGYTLKLTIDLPTQLAAWNAMEGRAGAVIALDPSNGNIIAMVSAPSFDPNVFTTGISSDDWKALTENPLNVLTNRAIQGQYPPASTFKIITAAAALDEKVVGPKTKIKSEGSFEFADHVYRDWRREGHGKINISRAIIVSADTFFYQVGLKLGITNLAKYAGRFGLGRTTGVGLGNEKAGLIPTVQWKRSVYNKPWYDGETVNASVGQGYVLTTPLQMLNAYAAIANEGRLFVPRIVDTVETHDGNVVRHNATREKARVEVSDNTIKLIKKALRGVVGDKDGTASWLANAKLKIAGKTGTAQVVRLKERGVKVEDQPYKLRDHAWFIGFAPYDDPKIAVVALVEHGGFGSSAAAPVALKVFETYLAEIEDRGAGPDKDK